MEGWQPESWGCEEEEGGDLGDEGDSGAWGSVDTSGPNVAIVPKVP